MDNLEFTTYLKQINDDYHNLAMDLLSKYDIFSNDICKYQTRLQVARVIIDYFNNGLYLTSQEGFDINILTYSN